MALKRLESDLESLDVFKEPKLSLEQYHTPPKVAAEMLHAIDLDFGLSGRSVLDLGCGCGILGLGCVNRGARKVLGIDIDEEALHIAEQNRNDVGLTSEEITFLQRDIKNLQLPGDLGAFDIVVCNPPFGTRCPNIDQLFVEEGLHFSSIVYSIHKSSNRAAMVRKAKDMGVHLDFLFKDLEFPLSATYKFHKFAEVCVNVDVIKFKRD